METKSIWHKVEAEENQGRILSGKRLEILHLKPKNDFGSKNTLFGLLTNCTNLPQTDSLEGYAV